MKKLVQIVTAGIALITSASAVLDKGWDANFTLGGIDTQCRAIAADGGITYVAGTTQAPAINGYLAAFSATGQKLWERSIGSGAFLKKIVIDASFVYACGHSVASGQKGVVIKLDRLTGVPSSSWADTGAGVGVRFFGGAFSSDFRDMVLYRTGVYAAGYTQTNASTVLGVLVRYDTSGNPSSSWVDTGAGVGIRTITGSGSDNNICDSITVDSTGQLFVTGWLNMGVNNSDGFVWKLNSGNGASSTTWPDTGEGVGIRRFTSGAGDDRGNAIAVRGTTVGVAGLRDQRGVVLQYSATGGLDWTFTMPSTTFQSFVKIAPHTNGFYVCGVTEGTGVVLNMSAAGLGQSWNGDLGLGAISFSPGVSLSEFGVVVDPTTDNPFFLSRSVDSDFQFRVDLMTIKSGVRTRVGSSLLSGPAEVASGLAVDPTGRVSVLSIGQTNSKASLISRFGIAVDYSATQENFLEGTLFDGGLGDLIVSDDQYYRIFNDDITSGATLDLRAFIPEDQRNPLRLAVTYEASVARPGIVEVMQVFNFTLGINQTRIGTIASTFDVFRISTNSTTPDRDIEDTSGQVRITLSWFPLNDEDPSQDGWLHMIDFVNWRVVY